MYESKSEPLLDKRNFSRRMVLHVVYAILLIVITLFIGAIGHWWLDGSGFHDAFVNAAFIVGGLGAYSMPETAAGRIFFAAYGFFVGLVVMATLGVVLAPLAHRIMHKFHLDEINDD